MLRSVKSARRSRGKAREVVGERVERDVTKQRVFSLQGLFDSTYKPNAHSYHIQLENILSILNLGPSVSGEWYLNGKRPPKQGGHSLSIPIGLRVWEARPCPSQAMASNTFRCSQMDELLSSLAGKTLANDTVDKVESSGHITHATRRKSWQELL